MNNNTRPVVTLQADHNAVAGYIEWSIINQDGTVAMSGEHPNLILDAGLDAIAVRDFSSVFAYNCVGTGNSTPTVAQIGLDAETGRTGNYLTSPTGVCGTVCTGNQIVMKRTYDWAMGALNGSYTEVGFSWASTPGSNLWSRSLFKDINGNPVSVSITSAQQLRVTYTLTVTLGTPTWADNTVSIAGLGSVSYKSRAQQAYQYGLPPGFTTVATVGTAASYSLWDNANPSSDVSTFSNSSGMIPASYQVSFFNATYPTAESLPLGSLPAALCNGYGGATTTKGAAIPFTSSTYVAGQFRKTRTIVADVNTANGDIQWIFSPAGGSLGNGDEDRYRPFAYFFPASIAKDNLHTLTLNFNYSWGRA